MRRVYDVAIIGAGICGGAVAYELSHYDLDICVIEKENDVSMGTTKANSAIIHAGYDPEPGTLMAKLNIEGSMLTKSLAQRLSFPYKQVGSVVIAFDQTDMKTIEKLYERGQANGVPDLRILGREELFALEPNINPSAVGALYAPTAAIVSPWKMCISLCENAAANGTNFLLGHEVIEIKKNGEVFAVTTTHGVVEAKYICNAAGVYSDAINNMIGGNEFTVSPSKGQYYILDKSEAGLVNTVCFQCPSEVGKGVLIAPTVDGNIIVGPNAEPENGRDDMSVSSDGMNYVAAMAKRTCEHINYRANIRNFAGLRANTEHVDFIIGASVRDSRFINIAGIKSPGLSSAPAIGKLVCSILFDDGLRNDKKENYKYIKSNPTFRELSDEEQRKLIAEDPSYGNVICRCSTVTEGEIRAALASPIPPTTIDGVKRRAGTHLGRCQGGFCMPRVHEILSSHYGVEMNKIDMERAGSWILSEKM